MLRNGTVAESNNQRAAIERVEVKVFVNFSEYFIGILPEIGLVTVSSQFSGGYLAAVGYFIQCGKFDPKRFGVSHIELRIGQQQASGNRRAQQGRSHARIAFLKVGGSLPTCRERH